MALFSEAGDAEETHATRQAQIAIEEDPTSYRPHPLPRTPYPVPRTPYPLPLEYP